MWLAELNDRFHLHQLVVHCVTQMVNGISPSRQQGDFDSKISSIILELQVATRMSSVRSVLEFVNRVREASPMLLSRPQVWSLFTPRKL